MSIPLKHHFVPSFFLERWVAHDGNLTQFSRPFGPELKSKPVHPNATAFELRLYSIGGLSDDLAQEVETEFFSLVDDQAAEALQRLEKGETLQGKPRSAWAKFLFTLMTRMPSDIRQYKQISDQLAERVLPKFRIFYDEYKSASETRDFDELVKQVAAIFTNRSILKMRSIMNNRRHIDAFSSFEWAVIDTSSARHELLTSDRPIIHTNGFGHVHSHIVLPIGPKKVFLAAKDKNSIRRIKSEESNDIVKMINEKIVGNAEIYVFGRNVSQFSFIKKYIGTDNTPSILDMLKSVFEGELEKFDDMNFADISMKDD